jgi:hypothetical protein
LVSFSFFVTENRTRHMPRGNKQAARYARNNRAKKGKRDRAHLSVGRCLAKGGHKHKRAAHMAKPAAKGATGRANADGGGDDDMVQSAFEALPCEIVVAILDHLPPRDVAAVASTDSALYAIARPSLDRSLADVLSAAGVVVDRDPVAHFAALHNAIARDDPTTVLAILKAGIISSVDDQMPSVDFLGHHATPVTIVFGIGFGDVMIGDCIPGTHRTWRGHALTDPHNVDSWRRTDRDISTMPLLSVSLVDDVPMATPLIKAVRYGSRRVVRALLAIGARAAPSLETLLACALDRLCDCAAGLIDHHMTTKGCNAQGAWGTLEKRDTDVVAIVGDLLATFERARPTLGIFDLNPLSVLRCVISPHRSDGFVPPVATLVEMLMAAGYSPDDPLSLICTGRLRPSQICETQHATSPGKIHTWSDGARLIESDEIAALRHCQAQATERQAAQESYEMTASSGGSYRRAELDNLAMMLDLYGSFDRASSRQA